MEISLGLLLPRDAASVPATRKILDAALLSLGVDDEIRGDIEIMLTEACTNVIKHAEEGAGYAVRATILDRRCVIKVIDSGRGFAPGSMSGGEGPRPDAVAESGRGLFIMRALADNVRFRSFPDNGALVALEKELRYEEDSLGGMLAGPRTANGSGDGQGVRALAASDPEPEDLATRLLGPAHAGERGPRRDDITSRRPDGTGPGRPDDPG